MPSFTAAQLAQKLGGHVIGDASLTLHGFAPADSAKPSDLTFAENETYYQRALNSSASAILVSGDYPAGAKTLIRVDDARVAFATVLPLFFPEPQLVAGIHPSAVVAASAQIDPTASIGPCCVVGERVRIGAGTCLMANDYVGDDSVIGENTRLFPNVTLYSRTTLGSRVRIHAGAVIGADGFGYVFDGSQHRKVPQVGQVVIHDDVEIGANTSIDRAALGATIIGKGTKIDNLVQIAHNVVLGEHCIIVAQVGIAGSTKVGNGVTIAGQVGVAGHLRIGDKVVIAAQSGVMNHVPEGQKWLGTPAQPDRVAKRQYLMVERLPELLRRVNELERRLEELGGGARSGSGPSEAA
ncbi:MAG TPA: UDP-3-O-(3-hydroxymyristoyl)glucosamine N-acyltransferase [Candidatus Limnocylindria bacterium]|jgi:UDP-3-O-[3-hydroxymyristoyl] glucosamine N-acyltransferase|nr:UDP-3-O-(3-hydroxymyristoyl)glucosamine N-acyltransferase [Candidatus Limnocylindria bacterium]